MARHFIGDLARMLKGPSHPRWKGGAHRSKPGYVRVTAGPNRGQYEHRVVASKAWERTHGVPLPKNYQVHHLDFCRWHNCLENLLILGPGLHVAGHVDGWKRNKGGQFAKPQDDEVPF